MKNDEWNNLRAKLHHDWLQNRYLTFLKSWKECFDNPAVCREDKEDVLDQLLQWKSKRDLFRDFLDCAEEALSPRQLLYKPPLEIMSEENKEWLGEVIHALFCSRTHIKDKVLQLQTAMNEIDSVIDNISYTLKKGEKTSENNSGERVITLFVNFSRAISQLPHEIQVV